MTINHYIRPCFANGDKPWTKLKIAMGEGGSCRRLFQILNRARMRVSFSGVSDALGGVVHAMHWST